MKKYLKLELVLLITGLTSAFRAFLPVTKTSDCSMFGCHHVPDVQVTVLQIFGIILVGVSSYLFLRLKK